MTTPFRAGQIITAEKLNARVEPGSELLDEIDLSQTIEFTNISQDFTHLQLVLWGGIADATATWPDVAMRLNNDNGSNYNWWRWARRSDDTPDSGFDSEVTGIRVCRWGDVGTRSSCTILIANYMLSNWTSAQIEFVGVRTGGLNAGNHIAGQVYGDRRVSEPISSIEFFIVGGSGFSTDSIASLYGLR